MSPTKVVFFRISSFFSHIIIIIIIIIIVIIIQIFREGGPSAMGAFQEALHLSTILTKINKNKIRSKLFYKIYNNFSKKFTIYRRESIYIYICLFVIFPPLLNANFAVLWPSTPSFIAS